jgi:hypothetical protein
MVFAADEAPEDGSPYVLFKLGSDDSVSLFQEDDLIDKMDWEDGKALIGYSYGRYGDGSENTQTRSPTPGYENQTAERGDLVINEIMAKDSDDGHDWFELYNAGISVVDLAEYAIVDDGDDQEPASLPELSLAPGDFAVIYATGSETYELLRGRAEAAGDEKDQPEQQLQRPLLYARTNRLRYDARFRYPGPQALLSQPVYQWISAWPLHTRGTGRQRILGN